MRVFCRYLYEQKLINKNIDYVIGGNRYIVKEKLPSIYTREEVLQIESSVNQSHFCGETGLCHAPVSDTVRITFL